MDKTFDEQALDIWRAAKEEALKTSTYPDEDTFAKGYARRIRAAALAEGGAREPVVVGNGTTLLAFLSSYAPKEVCGDDWTRGYEECKRRLYEVLKNQLRAAPIAPPPAVPADGATVVRVGEHNGGPYDMSGGVDDGATTQNAAASEDQRYVRKWTGDQYDYVPAAPVSLAVNTYSTKGWQYCQDEDCPHRYVPHSHTNTAPMLDNLARKAEPASPLLPGLERAIEILGNAALYVRWDCANAIRAEISRLKGEGRGRE